MKVRVFTTRLTQLNTYLMYFPPDQSGQLDKSLPDDNIKEVQHHAMPHTWKKKMVKKGYNYLDGPIYSMAKFFETRIENLEKSIHQVFPQETTGKARKVPRKGNWLLLMILMMKTQMKGIQERSFASTTVRVDIPLINVSLSRHWSSKQIRRKENISTRRKGTPNIRLTSWYKNRLRKLWSRK